MRNVLILFAFVLPLALFSCSKDEDTKNNKYEDKLIGHWIEDTDNEFEVLHIKFNEDKTGSDWAEEYGELFQNSKYTFKWSATENKINFTYDDGEIDARDYTLRDNKLYIGSIIYVKQ